MNYWHMQLHPNDINWEREEELLENFSLIGLGLSTKKQIEAFFKQLKPFDIVLIKRGSTPVALVEVESDIIDLQKNDLTRLDWFRYRRKVKILDIFNKTKLDISDKPINNFPSPRGTLTLIKNKKSPSYQYVFKWHQALYPEMYQTNDGLKICEINIHKYKIFENFNISCTNSDGKISPIIVLAGINGTGKTSFLDFIDNFLSIVENDDRSFIELNIFHTETKKITSEIFNYTSLWTIKKNSKEKTFLAKLYKNKIFYFRTDKNINDLKKFIIEFAKHTMHKKDLKPSQVFNNIRRQINEIFKTLQIAIEFDKVDENDNVFFKNKKHSFSIDEISAGEKTLLSKVLYLYLKDIKDSVILIDEPELSLHPAWQNKILKLYETFAKSNNCQMIIATHSPHIIGSAKKEYLRLLVMEDDQIKVVDNFSHSYGLEFNQILTNVMDVKYLRTPDVAEELSKIKKKIQNNEFDDSEFKKSWKYLESIFGEEYLDLKLLKLEIAARKKNVQNK